MGIIRSVVQQGTGTSDWQIVNWHQIDIQIGIGCTLVDGTGSATYQVEYCYEDVNAIPRQLQTAPLTNHQWPTVFVHPTFAGLTGNFDSPTAFTGPIAYFRLNVTDGIGTVVMTYIQSGIRG